MRGRRRAGGCAGGPIAGVEDDTEPGAEAEQATNGEKKKGPINIPLHGPRVDVILAWLGATHLPDLLEAAGVTG
jgi:hypothetical protein